MTVRVQLPVIVGSIAAVVNWDPHCQSGGSNWRQQSRELKGSSPTNLNLQELVEDEGLLEQDGDHEFFEDPFVMIQSLNNNKGQVSGYIFLKLLDIKRRKKETPQQYLEHFQSASRPRRVNFFARVNTASTLSHRWHNKEAVVSNHLLENYTKVRRQVQTARSDVWIRFQWAYKITSVNILFKLL